MSLPLFNRQRLTRALRVQDTLFVLVRGELLITHKPPPKRPPPPPGSLEARGLAPPKPPLVPRKAAGFELVETPIAVHKKFSVGVESRVYPPHEATTGVRR